VTKTTIVLLGISLVAADFGDKLVGVAVAAIGVKTVVTGYVTILARNAPMSSQ